MQGERQADYIAARFQALFGHGWRGDLAEAVGITLPRLSDQFTEDRVAASIIGHLEWLEANPPAKWPARWAKLADRAKAKAKADQKKAKAA
jgi:hypothetical protein